MDYMDPVDHSNTNDDDVNVIGKTYLRYVPQSSFGVIAGNASNAVFDKSGRYAVCSALQDVVVWDVMRDEICAKFLGENDGEGEVTCVRLSGMTKQEARTRNLGEIQTMEKSPEEGQGKEEWRGEKGNGDDDFFDNNATLLAGYSDGELRVWDFRKNLQENEEGELEMLASTSASNSTTTEIRAINVKHKFSLVGHKSAISCIEFNPYEQNTQVATGSRDTDIVLWDLSTESGICRLQGHKDEITDLRFILPSIAEGSQQVQSQVQLVSSSKDTLIKFWDLETQHCLHTIMGHRSSVWSFDTNPLCTRIFSGASDAFLRGFRYDSSRRIGNANKNAIAGNDEQSVVNMHSESSQWKSMPDPVKRESTDRAQLVRFSFDGTLLGVQAAGRVLEFYRVRTEEEIAKRIKRRLRRESEKQKVTKIDENRAIELSEVRTSDELELVATLRTTTRIRSFDLGRFVAKPGGQSGGGTRELPVLLHLSTNTLQVHPLVFPSRHDADAEYAWKQSNKKNRKELKESGVPWIGPKRTIEFAGHRTDIRAMDISSDSSLLLTAANGAVKLWNLRTQQCIRTIPSGFSLCVKFAPGDAHAIVGTKDGQLLVMNLASGSIVRQIDDAHAGAIWSIDIRPGQTSMASGSADKQVKFWDFSLEPVVENVEHTTDSEIESSDDSGDDDSGNDDDDDDDKKHEKRGKKRKADREDMKKEKKGKGKRKNSSKKQAVNEGSKENDLQLVHTRTLKLNEDVLCVKFSHSLTQDNSYSNVNPGESGIVIAVALLDCTVKVFHEDSLKFALSLYGHKLPVLTMDISDDNALIATGSADKNIKVWGLDFGDVHKSFFAHDAALTSVNFVPKTHYLFSSSKDRRIRFWDVDHFEMILSLEGHFGEIWCLALSGDGSFFVSAGHDKSIRVWTRSSDIVFLTEEREKRMEKMLEQERKIASGGVEQIVAVQASKGSGSAASFSESAPVGGPAQRETSDASDRIIEALEFVEAELEQQKQGHVQKSPLLQGRTPLQHMAHVLRETKPQDLEAVFLVLPFARVPEMLQHLVDMIEHDLHIEMAAKLAILLVKVHFKQLVSLGGSNKDLLRKLRRLMREKLQNDKDLIGTNVAGIRFLQRGLAENISASKHAFM